MSDIPGHPQLSECRFDISFLPKTQICSPNKDGPYFWLLKKFPHARNQSYFGHVNVSFWAIHLKTNLS